jgi:hypothetical protein
MQSSLYMILPSKFGFENSLLTIIFAMLYSVLKHTHIDQDDLTIKFFVEREVSTVFKNG